MTEPRKALLEGPTAENVRLIAEEVKRTNELLAQLIGGAWRPDFDYAVWEVSALGRPSFTIRVSRNHGEPPFEWFTRQKDFLARMEAMRNARVQAEKEKK